jgi:hypothetical protein
MAFELRERRLDGSKSPSEWEPILTTWSNGPGQTEKEKCENAENIIKKAIAANYLLDAMDISVFAQGSYRARTNVRQDSDVDICVRLNSTFFPDYPPGKKHEDFNNTNGSITFSDYKDLIHEALKDRFGNGLVTRGKKAFDVHANSYRVDADVLPAFEKRRYRTDGSYLSGVAFIPDGGYLTENWPDHNYNNGVLKHDQTGRRYKKIIRIIKRLRNEMQEDRIVAANNAASFLIECLVWNVPNTQFGSNSYYNDLRNVIVSAYNGTKTDETCTEWGEVNELKYLFRGNQPWTRVQANDFLLACYRYIGYK